MKHFYAALIGIGLIGLYISAGAADASPLPPCALAGATSVLISAIGVRGYNRITGRWW